MMGKILAQHYQEQGGGWKRKDRSFCPKIKSQSVIFLSNCLEPLLNKAKENSVCICIYFPIHWCVVCKGQSTWHALLLWMREGLQSVLRRHFCCTWMWVAGVNTSWLVPSGGSLRVTLKHELCERNDAVLGRHVNQTGEKLLTSFAIKR